jgi:adenosylcobinamide kinase/adenosylcobinamide-phosphate guanylyltransferase
VRSYSNRNQCKIYRWNFLVKTLLHQLVLVTGPARSGKSEWAETLAKNSQKAVVYVATAQIDPTDLEWQSRIQQHRLRRPAAWTTLQVPVDLAATIQAAAPQSCLLVDSLGTWVANGLEQDDAQWSQLSTELLDSLQSAVCEVILVAEETGWGVVPAYPLGRKFRDRLGSLTRQIGAIANPVYLVTAGHALNLSQLGTPLPTA